MNIYILRHGLAEERHGGAIASQDAKRPLTHKGIRKLKKIAKAMRKLELEFDLILSSPYTRARQTAEIIFHKAKGQGRLEFSETLIPAGNRRQLITYLKTGSATHDNVLLVGHEPYLSDLVSLLVFGKTGFSIALKKAGLCKLSTDALEHGRCATLHWLLTPNYLELMV